MQCLQQVAVPVGIDIRAYDRGRPCELEPDPKGEGITLFQDLNNFRSGTQIQPCFPKVLKSGPYRQILCSKFDICYRFYIRQVNDRRNTFDIF